MAQILTNDCLTILSHEDGPLFSMSFCPEKAGWDDSESPLFAVSLGINALELDRGLKPYGVMAMNYCCVVYHGLTLFSTS